MKNKNGTPPASQRENASRRDDLLHAAARLMRAKGYAATTIRDIAGAVGMGSGSPFCHFRNKQEILNVIAIQSMAGLLADAELLLTREMAPRERLQALMKLHAAFVHGSDSDFTAVMLHEWHILPLETKQHLEQLMLRYEAIWQHCIEALDHAEHLSNDTALSVRLILGSLNWSLNWFRSDRTQAAASDLADAAASVFQVAPAPDMPP